MKSSPDIEEIPEFTAEEVERDIKGMERHKAYKTDGITNDIIKLGRQIVLTYLTNIFSNIRSRFLTAGMELNSNSFYKGKPQRLQKL